MCAEPFAEAGTHPVTQGSEALAATLTAASSLTHAPTLTALAWRARQLWEDPASITKDRRGACVGCLPQHAHHPPLTAASAALRAAAVELAVLRDDWHDAYGEHGAQGVFLWPAGRGIEATWFIDGRDKERCIQRNRVAATRAARNAAITRVCAVLALAGWSVYHKASTNTATPRTLSMLAAPPH
ncbi:hypothetical protein ACIG3E_33670 [Streptomyces sp. NPDC053474]|uniref:hypothetical protein n=1 Tax=Streptomyces sp. NPDC053474 TaxID=3365704 RepID=UPI0037D15891